MWYSLLEDFLEILRITPRSTREQSTVRVGVFPFRRTVRIVPIKTRSSDS